MSRDAIRWLNDIAKWSEAHLELNQTSRIDKCKGQRQTPSGIERPRNGGGSGND